MTWLSSFGDGVTNISLNVPKEVQEPVEKGLFSKISDIEKMFSDEGKRRLAGIRETVEQCRDEEDLNDFKDLDDYYQLKKGNTN